MAKQRTSHSEVKVAGRDVSPAVEAEPVFRKSDWLALGITFVIALTVYAFTQAPTVTLEDSGELVVAADYLGVPHPPGYPLWTILAWIFQWIFHFKRYLGNPNPAWGVNFMSGFFGALSSGIVAMLVSRGGHDLLWFRRPGRGSPAERNRKPNVPGPGPQEGELDPATEQWITCASGIGAGLLLAFGSLLWSQCVIAEVYSLNTCIALVILMFSYMWLHRPEDNRFPYGIALVFGIGITNCQPITLIVPALMIVFLAADRALFRDSFALGLVFMALWVYQFRVRPLMLAPGGDPNSQMELWIAAGILMFLAPVGIWVVSRKLFTEWKRVLILVFCVGLGLSLFLYMPISSDTNPPMNWGYPRTLEGFKHAVTRGQYQALDPAIEPTAFMKQVVMFFRELEDQFTLPLLLVALLPIFYLRRIRWRERAWLGATVIGFLFFGVGLMAMLNPAIDIQSVFIARVQLIQAVAICALWIGYGFILGLSLFERVVKAKHLLAVALSLLVLLPLVPIRRNVNDRELIRTYGASDLQGHDFGWQFGCYQLCGAKAITQELKPGETPLPNPDYPPEMGQDAIFFGGTDPGRFVPTYMIFSAKVRPDVFLITQNALADNTYMSVMRDLYGDLIWIPTPQDSNQAFQRYVNDVRAGRISANAAVTIDASGKVSVQGVQGVMEINGIICKMIFEANKSKHDFYVEESYVINWMYPYLEPHGLIMKINKEPLPKLTDEMVKNDMDFWNWYGNRLMNNVKFQRDAVARKTFSKLRCAIAGVYAYRRLFDAAEAAFRQAIDLFPISPEANFRLADLYLQQGRFQDAYAVMEKNLQQDERNDKIPMFMKQIKDLEQSNERMQQLQTALSKGEGTLDMVFELATVYQKTGKHQQFYDLTRQVINNSNVPPDAYLKVAEMYGSTVPQRLDLLAEVLEKYLQREPGNPRIWFELACIRVALTQNGEALNALRKAIAVGGEPIRELAGKDQRLAPLQNTEEYQKLTAPLQQRGSPFPGAFIP